MRKSGFYLGFTLFCVIALTLLIHFYPRYIQKRHEDNRAAQIDLVRRLGLTDLCLFTEARYTRHPSQADLYSAFQDHPLALEHFPSGSVILPAGFSN